MCGKNTAIRYLQFIRFNFIFKAWHFENCCFSLNDYLDIFDLLVRNEVTKTTENKKYMQTLTINSFNTGFRSSNKKI